MIGSHRFMTYVVDPEVADANYLRHYFLSERGLDQIRRASPGSAGRNRTLGIEAFQSLEVQLPPVEEQRKMAQRLDHVNGCAAAVRTLCAEAENSVLQLQPHWLKGMTFQNLRSRLLGGSTSVSLTS